MGPAGDVLNEAFHLSGLRREELYLTNVVKHFRFVQQGKRRLHKKPSSREIYACRPWLESELKAIRPAVLVCLGATSAQALIGRDFRLNDQRGKLIPTEWCAQTLATWHPSAILRMQDRNRQAEMLSQLVQDLNQAKLSAQ